MKYFLNIIHHICNWLFFICLCGLIFSCQNDKKQADDVKGQFISVLGTAQDAGFPHIDNFDEFDDLLNAKIDKELVVSLGLIDSEEKQKWLFEATPNMPYQLDNLERHFFRSDNIIDGVFLTHAHIGHYTGLMYFGHEAMGASAIPVYAMPRMKTFLETNGPWSQLVDFKNIELHQLKADSSMTLSDKLKVTPFLVPHRDEFSETVGYKIEGINKSALFIPDINKWSLWNKSIVEEVKKVDYAFVDATFFKDGEIPRPMSEVQHPFIEETIKLFENESAETKSKVIFIHFNHSNPGILKSHRLKDSVQDLGFNFAKRGDLFDL
ncbi:MAG: MBL fold metallo-hydrolase [Flavobacteriaceae bacterium]|nr:MBL fold metallo-hydrolase [Flavobacteriaceae bacterium]